MSVQVYGCNHVAIEVDDVEKAVAFYKDVFNLEQMSGGEGDAFFKLGEHQFLAIFEVEKVERANMRHFGIMVRDETQLKALFDKVGAFDHLVYTAGEALTLAPLLDTDTYVARQFFEIRFWGAYTAVKYATPHIRPGGSIVLSSGGSSQRPGPGWAVASSALGAMEALARALAVELAPIRVNVVRPGMVATDLWQEFPPEVREATERRAPHRIAGYALELAQAFAAFYRDSPVLKEPDAALRAFRLGLCLASQKTLAAALGLLGVSAPEAM
jgi:NAD(P)-dependent dehydrogenase (short-subunit alcohol dehydrogenase family)